MHVNIGIQYVLLIIKRIVCAELSTRYCQRSVSIDREVFEYLRWFTWYRFVCYMTPISIVCTFYLLAFAFTGCKLFAMEEAEKDYLLVRSKEGWLWIICPSVTLLFIDRSVSLYNKSFFWFLWPRNPRTYELYATVLWIMKIQSYLNVINYWLRDKRII